MKVEMVPTRAQQLIACGRVSGKHTVLRLGSSSRSDTIHFWDEKPIAVWSGGCVWHHAPTEGAITKMLNAIEPVAAPRIRADASHFDYMIGQVLTSAGLPLTKQDNPNAR